MAITNYDGIISNRAAGKDDDKYFQKTGTVGGVTGNWYSFIKAAGYPSSATYGNATAGGTILTSTSPGAIPLLPTTGDSKYLLTVGGCIPLGPELSVLGFVDVLWAGAGIQCNSSSTYTVNSAALTRCTDGIGVMMGVMVSTAIGATATTATIWYTDSDDNATSVNVVLATAGSQGRMLPALSPFVPLVAGDKGVKSIQSVQVQTAQGSGAIDLFLCKPLAFIPTIALNTWVERDMTAQIDGIVQLRTDTANTPGFISVIGLQSGTTARGVVGFVRTVAG